MEIGSFLHHHFVNALWHIKPENLEVMRNVLLSKMEGMSFEKNNSSSDPLSSKDGKVAILNIEGVLVPKASYLDSMCGFKGTQVLRQEFQTLVNDNGISRIVLNIDSPGGVSTGIGEFAEEIFQARQEKEIVAFTNGNMCSAAYWLASAAENIIAEPSATIGSIGTYICMTKESDLENIHIFQAGSKKLYGSSITPISEDEINFFSEKVEKANNKFLSAVSKYRGVSFEDVKGLEAGYFSADEAPEWLYTEINNFSYTFS